MNRINPSQPRVSFFAEGQSIGQSYFGGRAPIPCSVAQLGGGGKLCVLVPISGDPQRALDRPLPDTPKDEPFLSRWSRVKTEGEPAAAEPEAPPAEVEEELSDAELLEKLGLPDPLLLKEGDDVSGFMSSQVPEHLRRIALRFLWRSNPLLANVDGLVDYGEDFTDAATVIENMQTIYQVGKGAAWKFKEEQEARALAEAEAETESRTGDALQRTKELESSDAMENAEGDAEEVQPEMEEIQLVEADTEMPSEPPAATAPRPRPMRFDFD